MPKPILFALLAVFLLGLPAPLRAEDEAEAGRAYARSVLLKRAYAAVRGRGTNMDAVAAMRRGLAADMALVERTKAESEADRATLAAIQSTIEERILLVGLPPTEEGEGEASTPGSVGALQEAVELGQWLRGKAACAIEVATTSESDPVWRAYPYPPEPEAAPASREASEPKKPGESDAPKDPEPSPPGGKEAPGKEAAGADEAASDAADDAKPGKQDVAPAPAPAEPLDLGTWARQIVRAREGGSLRGRVLRPAVCTTIDALLEAAGRAPVYVHEGVRGLTRHALLEDGHFEYNEPFAAVRLLQADERNKAMQSDQPPPSLVDGAMVREKAGEAARFEKQFALRGAQRERVVSSLDQMVDDLDGWRTQAALLGREIEAYRRAAAPPEKDNDDKAGAAPAVAKPEDPLGLRLAQARESLASIEITLLYLTAVRAEARLELLDVLLRACAEEATAAEQVHARYEIALQRLRSERRLDRLHSDERMLGKWIRDIQQGPRAEQPLAAQRLAAYRAVKQVNEIVQDAVVGRTVASGGEGAAAVAQPEANQIAPDDGSAPKVKSLLTRVVREPRTASWDIKYLQIARRALEDPALRTEFGAGLVAVHYAVAEERIGSFLAALSAAKDEKTLRPRFEAALAEAEAALAPLANDAILTTVRGLPAMLQAASSDFDAAVAGIREQREENEGRLGALVAYRDRLLQQGTRSLLIRVDRDLARTDLGDVVRDTGTAIETASDWALLQGEDNLGGFLRVTWSRVLAVLAALAVLFWLARRGRRLVDRWIEKKVAAYPSLHAHGASVREERERARVRRDADNAAAESTSLAQVLQTENPETAEESVDAPVVDVDAPVVTGAVPPSPPKAPPGTDRRSG